MIEALTLSSSSTALLGGLVGFGLVLGAVLLLLLVY
jgi:hypothetical protein